VTNDAIVVNGAADMINGNVYMLLILTNVSKIKLRSNAEGPWFDPGWVKSKTEKLTLVSWLAFSIQGLERTGWLGFSTK